MQFHKEEEDMQTIALKCLIASLMIGALSIVSIKEARCGKSSGKTKNKNVMIRFKNIYEASGVQQIGDGRVVIIEDEKERAISHVLTLGSDGTLQEDPLELDQHTKKIKTKLNDLEGIAVDAGDNVFAITSHSRNVKGKLKHSRERFARFKIKGNLITDFKGFDTLGGYIRQAINADAINIEAISFDATGKSLLIGLREPLFEGKSLIVVLENPNAIFDHDENPRISSQIFRLDLNGGGIRAMDYNHKLGGFLLVNEISNAKGKIRSRFWFWNGNAAYKPRKVTIRGMENLRNIEGITSINNDGEPRLLIVSDDGKIHKQKAAHYKLIRYDQLLIAPGPISSRLSSDS